MHAGWFDQLEALMAQHGLVQVAGREIGCVKFAKVGLNVETCNHGETFEVRHDGGPTYSSPSLTDLAHYLENLPI